MPSEAQRARAIVERPLILGELQLKIIALTLWRVFKREGVHRRTRHTALYRICRPQVSR